MTPEVLKKIYSDFLKALFRRHYKFVSLDGFIKRLEALKRVFITSLFDCCRERMTKGSNDPDVTAQSHTFYACRDGSYADAGLGGSDDSLSPTTDNWLQFMYGNPGGPYPLVLKEFQYGILNKCEESSLCSRNLVFVRGLPKPWKTEDFFT